MSSREDNPLFKLEGRLAGDQCVEELLRIVNQNCLGKNCVFDIEHVFYVDSPGEETLLWLSQLGATFITQNAYGKDLCQRLHLRRSTPQAKAKAPAAQST